MRIRATLIKTATDDGIVDTNDDIEVGKPYTVELQSIRVRPWGKADGSVAPVDRFSIFVYDDAEATSGGWMPLEMLKLEAN